MKLIIDIPEETYNKIRRGEPLYPADANVAIFAIETGIPIEECGDCISRQAVLDKEVYTETSDGWTGWTVDVNDIKELPPVTPQSKWIFVSERLPEDGEHVLFCDIDDDIMIGYHVKGRPDTHFTQNGTYEDIKNVKAWKPLPDKPESEEQNG